jgi:hypothetical protein
MKELFLSSMMQWMAKPVPASMDALIVDRAIRLREQMKTDAKNLPRSRMRKQMMSNRKF